MKKTLFFGEFGKIDNIATDYDPAAVLISDDNYQSQLLQNEVSTYYTSIQDISEDNLLKVLDSINELHYYQPTDLTIEEANRWGRLIKYSCEIKSIKSNINDFKFDDPLTDLHSSKKFANMTLEYHGLDDSKELFEKNLKTKFKLLESNGWLNKEIQYKFNSEGFRSEEFSSKPGIIFLGCSHTFGTGLPLTETWPYRVATSLNLECYNLSIPGASNSLCFRMLYNYVNKINSNLIVWLRTYKERFEISEMNIDQPYQLLANDNRYTRRITNFYSTFLGNDQNILTEFYKNTEAIKNLAHEHSKKLLILENNLNY